MMRSRSRCQPVADEALDPHRGVAALEVAFQGEHRGLAAAEVAAHQGLAAQVAVDGDVLALGLEDRVRVGQVHAQGLGVETATPTGDVLGEGLAGGGLTETDELGGADPQTFAAHAYPWVMRAP